MIAKCPYCGYYHHGPFPDKCYATCPRCGYYCAPFSNIHYVPCNLPSELQPEREFDFSYTHPEGKFRVGELVTLPSNQKALVLGFHVRWMDAGCHGLSFWWTKVVVEYKGGPDPGMIIAHDDCIVERCSVPTNLRSYNPSDPLHPPRWIPKDHELLQGKRCDYYHTVAGIEEIEIPYRGLMILVVQYGISSYYEIVRAISKPKYRDCWGLLVSEIVCLPWKEIDEVQRRAIILGCHGYMHYWGKE